MRNDELEKALEETWKNKEKFYEETKDLSMLEIIKKIENKYKAQGTAHNRTLSATQKQPEQATSRTAGYPNRTAKR